MASNAEEHEVLDELFMERMEAFTEKTLSDIRSFAERERCSVDIVRRYVAERQSKYLFSTDTSPATSRSERIRSVLVATSRMLESLHATAGVHSFFVAVDPDNPDDEGFLGGTPLGREFWRGMRAGGASGARAFHAQAVNTSQGIASNSGGSVAVPTIPSKLPSHQLKAEVYAGVRAALRATSGIRNADMKWTNHERLGAYGVRIEGWPPEIPFQNPSSLSVSQNRILKDCLDRGTLRFHRLNDNGRTDPSYAGQMHMGHGELDGSRDISWAVAEEISTSSPASWANDYNMSANILEPEAPESTTASWRVPDPHVETSALTGVSGSAVSESIKRTPPSSLPEDSTLLSWTGQDGARKRKRDDGA